MSYNDSLKGSLVALGYEQSLPDALNKFLQDRTDIESTTTPDMMYAWLENLGFTLSLNDKLQAYAVSKGFDSHAAQVLAGSFLSRWALNFDGVGIRGVLSSRAINPDGDIDIEWEQLNYDSSMLTAQTIIAQCISNTGTLREFYMRSETNESLSMVIGGTSNGTPAGVYGNGKWKLTTIGLTWQVYKDGVLVHNAALTKGGAREPAAATFVGARNNAGTFTDYLKGLLYNIRINGTLWPMADRNQPIQPSVPAGNNMTISNATSANWVEIPA